MAAKGVDLACGKIAAMAKAAVVDPDMPKPVVRVAEPSSALHARGEGPDPGEGHGRVPQEGRRRGEDDGAGPAVLPERPGEGPRAVLYHMFPHDKTIWASVKDPWWWFYTQAWGAFPLWGVTTAWWFVVLLCKWSESPVDEFQLVDFVVSFKASQFTTACVPGMVVRASLYVSCIPDCSSGAGSGAGVRPDGVALLRPLLSLLGRLALLPWSAVKGGYHYEPVRASSRR